MYIFLVIVAIVVCVLLGLMILIQNPKGGGLSSGFSGSNNVMGVQRTGDFLEKGTWVLAITLMVLALLINLTIPKNGVSDSDNDIQNQIQTPASNTAPIAPVLPQADTSKKQ